MPPYSSGRIVKSRKGKPSTPHQKNHRWESFTTKISKLHSLDPLRRTRRHDLEIEDLQSTTSYLRNGLERWADVNISRSFTSFRREVLPLCDSLPQILHFEGRIMELLATYIWQQEKESLEPLLDLLAAFAHDLGMRFEKHYALAMDLITNIVSRPQDAEVIEWAFACLAFLFKYLSKLLVPDLRPTYNLMAPLLGKAKNPPHIARFAAEAMSFLIKKAAAPAHRDKSLPLIVEHSRVDLRNLCESRQHGLYYHGIMTMYAEAIKGQGNGIHTTGPDIFQALVMSELSDEYSEVHSETWPDAVCGILVSVLHHATVQSFEPLGKTILEMVARDSHRDPRPMRSVIYMRLLGAMAGVRNGSRVSDWSSRLDCLQLILKTLSMRQGLFEEVMPSSIWQHVLLNVGIVWSQAPMEAVISHVNEFMKTLTASPWINWFIPFCLYFSDLNSTRFRSLFLKHFQRYVATHWSDGTNEDMLCISIPHMTKSEALSSETDTDAFVLPQTWQDQVIAKFERLEISPFPEPGASRPYSNDPKTWHDRCLPKYLALLQLLESTTVRPSTLTPISDLLLRKLKLALRPSLSPPAAEAHFIVGQGLNAYIRLSRACGQIDTSLGPLLRAAAPRYCRVLGFVDGLLAYAKHLNVNRSPRLAEDPVEDPEKDNDPLLEALVDNLCTPSHGLRLTSLQLLCELDIASDELDTLATMLQTEQTALDIQNVRAISVHIRKLGATYSRLSQASWLRRAIPQFLFGMTTVRLTPVWESAVEALQRIASEKSGENAICDLAFSWIDAPSKRLENHTSPAVRVLDTRLTDFECPGMARLQNVASFAKQIADDPAEIMLHAFEESQQLVQVRPDNARSQALKVLSATPSLAEKRSRRLVPYLLAWGLDSDNQQSASEDDSKQVPGSSWSLLDRKLLLGLFAQFSNPRVLFQSQNVYEALLSLLGNGDVEIQKSALRAILSWKQEGIKPYREHLEYLLDEARFKNELTVLFQGDNQIQSQHRLEMMPVLLRLLYGRTISKKGMSNGRHGFHATRLAVLRSLSVEDLGGFLDIALGRLGGVKIVENAKVHEDVLSREIITARKQVGFLNMMEDLINELGSSVLPYTEKIVNAIVYCLIIACRNLNPNEGTGDGGIFDGQTSLHKVARAVAIRCLNTLLRNAPGFDWTAYGDPLIKEVVSPRLEKLPIETAQGVSGVLQLLCTLSLVPKTTHFLALDDRTIGKLAECLVNINAKDDVKVFILGIIQNVVKMAKASPVECEFNELIREELLDPNLDKILEAIGDVLRSQGNISQDLMSACVEAVLELCPIFQQSHNAIGWIEISLFLLDQPPKHVNPKIKNSVLLLLKTFLQVEDLSSSPQLRSKIYSTIASLYGFFKDRSSRQALSDILTIYGGSNTTLCEVAKLCSRLNSFAEGLIDEPDYGARLAAFNEISRGRTIAFTPREWEPLLYNMLFYITRDEEYGILASNSADCICKFVEEAADSKGSAEGAYHDMLSMIILPAIDSGAREASETVRREYVRVVGCLVSRLPSWPPVSDLACLGPQQDESEADVSFFSDILSPAALRQIRALQLLSRVHRRMELDSRHLARFLIPLLEHFVFDRPEGSDDRGVGAQAAITIADLAISLEWPQYRAILRRYVGYIEAKPGAQKQLIRLLGKLVDTLSAAKLEKSRACVDSDDEQPKVSFLHRLAVTFPAVDKFNNDIASNVMPSLLNYLHEKDEATVSSRVPVGIIMVKLLKLLPSELSNQKLPGVLSDICHILRSKSVESRDMARDTLAKMTSLLGPSAFSFVVDELRGALTKGYQLHVLSYTLHTLLVNIIPQIEPGDLDYCLDTIVSVIMDDVFGVTGQEKDAEDYVSKMKEVKSSKSQDSMQLIAQNATIDHLFELVRPLHLLLLEKLDLRMVRKIDELLNRIAAGLYLNTAAESRNTLIFCYEIIQQAYQSEKPGEVEPLLDPKLKRYLVQKGAKKSGDRGTTSKYAYKIVRFAFDILRSILKRYDSLRNAGNITGFVPILGDAVLGGEEEVKIAAMKLLAVLVRVPFKTDDGMKLYQVAVKEAIKNISNSTSTETDLAQTSLKLISVTLRDRHDVFIRDVAVDMLLDRLKEDLTNPLYRHVTFNFLRSILERKVASASVYDTLDYVGTIMITNDDKSTRDLARGAFFQFLREYPQKKSRWAKQLSFIVANLKYEREGGRLSVMEICHLLLTKSTDDFVQEIAATCFLPLVFVLANDESEKCRMAAGELVKEIFRKADRERHKMFLNLLRGWIRQTDNPSVSRLAIQAFGFYFDVKEPTAKDTKDVGLLVQKATEILDDDSNLVQDELVTIVLQTIPILLEKFPATVMADEKLWDILPTKISIPASNLQLPAIRLLNIYLADFDGNFNETNCGDKTVNGSYGLLLSQDKVQQLAILAVGVLSPATISRWKKRTLRKMQISTDAGVILGGEETNPPNELELDEHVAMESVKAIMTLSKFLEMDSSSESPEPGSASPNEDVEEDAEEDDDEWRGFDDEDEGQREDTPRVTIRTLLLWLSDILTSETRADGPALVPKVAALDVLCALAATRLPAPALRTSLLDLVLTPLHHLTDPAISVPSTGGADDVGFRGRLDALRSRAAEAMDALRSRAGTSVYTRSLLAVREGVRRRREARGRKRKIDAVAAPERWGKWKRGRLERKVRRRKEKAGENRRRRRGV